jgi:hypothetical protein
MTSGYGNVNFRVLVDGVERFYKTGVTSTSDGDRLNIDVSGASTITLIVESNGGITCDHAVNNGMPELVYIIF